MSYVSARVPSLPPELVNFIVRYTVTRELSLTAPSMLSAEVVAGLRHMALVARVWRAPSQAELFFTFSLCAEYADSLQIPRLLFLSTRPHLARHVRVLALGGLLLPLQDMDRWLPHVFPAVTEVYVGIRPNPSLAGAGQLHLPLPLLAGFSRLKQLFFISLPNDGSEAPQETAQGIPSDMKLLSVNILSTSRTIMTAMHGIKRSGSALSLENVGLYLITRETMALRTVLHGFTNIKLLTLTMMPLPINTAVDMSGPCFFLARVKRKWELTNKIDISFGSLPKLTRLILAVSGDEGGIDVLRMLFNNAELPALRSLSVQMISFGEADRPRDEAGNLIFLPASTFPSDMAHPHILSNTISRQLKKVDISISATRGRPMVAGEDTLLTLASLFGPASKDAEVFTIAIAEPYPEFVSTTM
jgi:hypothetical protein